MHRELFFYADRLGPTPCGISRGRSLDDFALIDRIIAAYRASCNELESHGGIIWETISRKSLDVHSALMSGDKDRVAMLLRNPHLNNLLYGFENLFDECVKSFQSNPELGKRSIVWAHDSMLRLAEIVRAIPTHLPEVNFQTMTTEPDALVDALETALGILIRFPNPFPHEYGVLTRRGLASHRALQAIYQAWRLNELIPYAKGNKILEIGAGLGRTAFYANAFGITNYTIVDLPLANVAQAYFLGMTLGSDKIILYGEPERSDPGVSIYTPYWFWSNKEFFNIVLNADSITEMDFATALRYWKEIEKRSSLFVSINHEAQSFRVADLPKAANSQNKLIRFPYAMRKGYVEEIAFLR